MCITSKLGKFAPNRIHGAPTATAEDAFQREPAEYAEFFICASHVRLGSFASYWANTGHVRFAPAKETASQRHVYRSGVPPVQWW
jgi:hypothetical protein